jgi:hypothetical protein
MSLKPSTKLMLSIVGILVVLFISAPTVFAYGWQLIHGREVTLGGLSFRLDPGWIVLHGSAARLPEDIFIRSSEETFISATQIKACQTEQSASAILLRLHGGVTKQNSLPSTYATIPMAGKRASCFIVANGDVTHAVDTVCLSPGRQNIVTIHASSKYLKYQSEAIHMLGAASETSTCVP